jgi:hypothetical protein
VPSGRSLHAHRVAVAIAAAGAALAACGADERAAPTDPSTARAATPRPAVAGPAAPRPALCGPVRRRVTGHVAAPQATELSGLVASPDQPGVLWTHNDSGDKARILAVRADGTLLADLDVPGAAAIDWEDLAVGPGPGGRALYLGDIGDNAQARETIDVYRVPEPRAAAAATGATAPATRLRLRYPDGPHDAETLLVAPRGRELLVVTKRFSGESGVYVARLPAGATAPDAAPLPLRRAATLHLGLGGAATAGDVSADGRVVVVRTYTGYFVWAVARGATLAATLRRAPCRGTLGLGDEGQGEALALSAHGAAFLTVPEGTGAAVRRYAAARR